MTRVSCQASVWSSSGPSSWAPSSRNESTSPLDTNRCRPGSVAAAQQAELAETMHHLEGGLVGRTDERDLGPHHVADRAGEERVVGAARAAAHRRRPRGSGASRRSASTITSSPLVWPRSTNSTKPGQAALVNDTGAPVSTTACRYAPEAIVPTVPITPTRPVDRRLHQGAGTRLDDVDDRDGQLGAEIVEPGRGGGVAGDDDRLHVVVRHEAPREFVRRTAARRRAGLEPYG